MGNYFSTTREVKQDQECDVCKELKNHFIVQHVEAAGGSLTETRITCESCLVFEKSI